MPSTPLPISRPFPTNHVTFPDWIRQASDGLERVYTLPDATQSPWKLEDTTVTNGISTLADFDLLTAQQAGPVLNDQQPWSAGAHNIVFESWWNICRADGSLGPDPGFHDLVTGIDLNVRGITGVSSATGGINASLPLFSISWEAYSTLGDSDLTLIGSGVLTAGQSLLQPVTVSMASQTDAGILIRITASFVLVAATQFVLLTVPEASPVVEKDIPDLICVPPDVPDITLSSICSDMVNNQATVSVEWPAVDGTQPITYAVWQRITDGTDVIVLANAISPALITAFLPGSTVILYVKASNRCGDQNSAFTMLTVASCTASSPPPPTTVWQECTPDVGPGLWQVLLPEVNN